MVQINPSTITWSLVLSRWKQAVMMSSSLAFLQMGRFCAMQNARLHWLQAAAAGARGSRSAEERVSRLGADAGLVLGVSSMMVLLVKHVHLQKEGGAGGCQSVGRAVAEVKTHWRRRRIV